MKTIFIKKTHAKSNMCFGFCVFFYHLPRAKVDESINRTPCAPQDARGSENDGLNAVEMYWTLHMRFFDIYSM